jgi:general secretion pathway protein F/MSHA biogenesis protein MshG
MKYFEVTALKKGKKEIILIDALDKEGAFAKVKDIHKAMPLKSKEVDAPLKERIRKSTDKFFAKMKANKKVDIDELIIVTRQMSVMLSAGISVNEVLEESKNFTKNKLLKVILEQSLDGINAGRSITESMSQYKGALGSLTISMVKFGEQTGSLDEALGMLSDTLENIRDNTDKFKKALRYPIVTIIAIAIAFTILILFVVPKFKSIFESLNADLPVPTLILLNLVSCLFFYLIFISK